MYKLSKYLCRVQEEELFPNKVILYSTRTGILLELNKDILKGLKKGIINNISDAKLEILLNSKIMVPEGEDEFKSIIEENIKHKELFDKHLLSFTIQPTADCQLGCHYCGQVHSKFKIKRNNEKLIYRRIESKVEDLKETIKRLSIRWYGGEPIMGLETIQRLSKKLINLTQKHNIKYSAEMVTNGLMLKYNTWLDLVSNYNVSGFQITIDGTETFHNKRRMLKNGRPSYKKIYSNVKEIVTSEEYQKRQKSISIRMNIDAENKGSVMEFIDVLNADKILHNVNLYVSPIHDWGGNGASEINGIGKEEFAQFEIDVFLKLKEYGIDKDDYLPKRTYVPCMVTLKNGEVFDAYGNISSCWEVPYTPLFNNKNFIFGNLNVDEEINTADSPMRNFLREVDEENMPCKGCNLFPVCAGACPQKWKLKEKPCPTYYYGIEDRILLSKLSQSLKNGK